MFDWTAWYRIHRAFRTSLSAADCARILRDTEPTFGDLLNPNFFEVKPLEDGRMLLIFKGKRFGKAIRTQYLMRFADEPGGCVVTLDFHRELLGLPSMTTVQEIDLFMKDKLQAIPITT